MFIMKQALIGLIVLLFAACNKNESAVTTRSFYMGFSPWLYDNTLDAQDWTYTKIMENGDIVSHHIEEGVPWPEAFAGTAFSESYTNEILTRLQRTPANKKVLLQISPLNNARNGIANYRGNSVNEPLPAEWTSAKLNDVKTKTAFLNYARRMIDYFNPDYLLLGVESNLLIRNNRSIWPAYVDLHTYVYTELKKEYPSIEFSLSVFCVPYFPEWSPEDTLSQQMDGLSNIEPYVDYLAFSIHPFMSGLFADTFPDNYLQKLFGKTTKPIAISESSYSAQSWEINIPPLITFKGTLEKQEHFLSLLLKEAQNFDAKYVIWFAIRDYDALWNNALGKSELALPWRDTGLFDEGGNPRKAFSEWDKWYNYAYE